MPKAPLLALNLARTKAATGFSGQQVWKRLLEMLSKITTTENQENWFKDAFRLIRENGKTWTYQEHQSLAFEALYTGKCNCSCGVQLLLCVAEAGGLLGTFGEAKWKDHTTLAHRRPNGDVWILETTNKNPSWKPLEKVKRCMFKVSFDPQQIFLSSMAELARKTPKRKEMVVLIFSQFGPEFWKTSGGDLAWLCWKWINSSDAWRVSAWPLVEEAIVRLEPMVGTVVAKRALIMLYIVTDSPAVKKSMASRIRKMNENLKKTCP